jgi:putative transposase/transposase-like zinc-binding protein
MISQHPLKQILIATRKIWDRPSTPPHVRETFLSIVKCGTIALGAEVYASATARKVVYHTCKSRFCPSCGQRATEAWQEELEAILPDIPYIGMTLTIPEEFRPTIQENRDLLHGLPAMAANAIQVWAKVKYRVRVLVIVVQQTFGGFLNFHPHLHIMVSAGGLQESRNRWIDQLDYDQCELMRAWRFAVIAFLAEALKKKIIKPDLFGKDLMEIFKVQHKREWHVFISGAMSKAHFLHYAGRYIRRPPIARHRLNIINDRTVEYSAKDTRNDRFQTLRFSTEKFLHILMQHVPDARRHGMRYFGLLAPRSIGRTSAAVFMLLGQKKRPKPRRLDWASLLLKCFGKDPLVDERGERMYRVGRLSPKVA